MKTSLTGSIASILTLGSGTTTHKAILIGLLFVVLSTYSFAGKKYSAANGNWTAGATWVGGVAPVNNDTVFVLKQHTVIIDANLNYTSSYLFVVVIGTLDMTNNGKLRMNASSKVIIETGGRILGDGNNDYIDIGGAGGEYNGSQGNITGPAYISNNHPPSSGEGTSGCGCYNGIGVASCTIVSSNGYTVHILVWARKILVETNPCTGGYTYDVRMDYSVQFTGSNIPANLWTLQGNIHCGTSSMYFPLPLVGGTGTVDSQGNAWRSLADCASATPTSLGCMNATISIQGPGLSSQTCSTPLPIELMSFEGNQCNEGICLGWSTASEQNFDKFIVEHSTDGLHYDSVGFIPGTGNSKVRVDYQFSDFAPILGKNYYRLKSLDNDLSFEYSPVIHIDFSGDKNLVVFPNPIQQNTLKVRTNFRPGKGDMVEIFDNLGLKISEFQMDGQDDSFGFNTILKPGSYLMRYTSEDYSKIVRFTSN